jgi:LEA14-like dessication related protein
MAIKPNFFNAVAVAVLAWRVFEYAKTQYRLLQKWDYSILGTRIKTITPQYLDMELKMEIKNLSGISLTVADFDMDVFVDGVKIGSAQKRDAYNIPKYGTNELTFNVRSYYAQVGPAIKKVLARLAAPGETPVRLKGRFMMETVPGVFVPVPFDFTDNALNLYKTFFE